MVADPTHIHNALLQEEELEKARVLSKASWIWTERIKYVACFTVQCTRCPPAYSWRFVHSFVIGDAWPFFVFSSSDLAPGFLKQARFFVV
jgi:hypothetical protein